MGTGVKQPAARGMFRASERASKHIMESGNGVLLTHQGAQGCEHAQVTNSRKATQDKMFHHKAQSRNDAS